MNFRTYFFLNKLLQVLIKKGKKSLALNTFLKTLRNMKIICRNEKTNLKDFLIQVFKNITPKLYIRKSRRSKKVYYLPKIINKQQETKIALLWFSHSVANRKENDISLKVTNEILDCYNGIGSTVGKRRELYDEIIKSRPFLNLLIFK